MSRKSAAKGLNRVVLYVVAMTIMFLQTQKAFAASQKVVTTNDQKARLDLNLLVEKVGRQILIDPNLLAAVITQESGWHKFATSPKGAMGLMQLMPETARNWGVKDPFDPLQNISGGARHLKYLIELFDRNIPLALAAYHAGEARILREGTIPKIKETKAYVQAVQDTYERLTKLNPH